MSTDEARLRDLASRFHAAIVETDRRGTRLETFPSETCDLVCRMLGLYLLDCGETDIAIMSGKRPNGESGQHHWLTVGGTTVDITAEQFGQDNVIVTVKSEFHDTLDGRIYEAIDDSYRDTLMTHAFKAFTREMYFAVRETLETNSKLDE